jgi:colanic acid/amylovoran biosynthesis glycosyltransferase
VDAGTRLQGVRLVRLADWDEPRLARMLGALWYGLVLAVVAPPRLARLLRALWRKTPSRGVRRLAATVGGLRDYGQLARLRPDVVHAEWESAAAFNLPLIDVWRCPFVVSCHGAGVNVFPTALPDSPSVTRLSEVFRRASAVHCVSEAVIAEAQLHGLDPAIASVIRPAVDPAVFSPDGAGRPDPDELRIVSVGTLIWLKGYEYGLQALALLVQRGIGARLDIAGPEPHGDHGFPSDLERIEHTIVDLGLEDRVRLHGRIASSEVRGLLREADVLLHSSLSEGIPTVALEAMACGVPVVTTDCGGVREVVRDGVDGLVVPPRDAAALAAALRQVAENPELRRRMGASGRERVREVFALDAQLAAYVALYDRVLQPPVRE